MYKYGIENFKLEVVEECSEDKLDELEIYYINLYQTFPVSLNKGYNNLPGGQGRNSGKRQKIDLYGDDIIKDLQVSSLNISQIATKYHLSKQVIDDINEGKSHHQKHLTYPLRTWDSSKYYCNICGAPLAYYKSRTCRSCQADQRRAPILPYEELLKLFYETQNRELVAQYYGVAGDTVRKWCSHYGFNALQKNKYKNLYETQVLEKVPPQKYKIVYEKLDPSTESVLQTYSLKKEILRELRLKNTTQTGSLTQAMQKHVLYHGFYFREVRIPLSK